MGVVLSIFNYLFADMLSDPGFIDLPEEPEIPPRPPKLVRQVGTHKKKSLQANAQEDDRRSDEESEEEQRNDLSVYNLRQEYLRESEEETDRIKKYIDDVFGLEVPKS